ncbi:putative methyltransferase PMT16 [Platanthera guangdongensis]|uniref:Methyltransferase n=1 Tax=Platanthera guangdongensis TaxID=2320717 RepID=A0ABR2LEU1_9ASPA
MSVAPRDVHEAQVQFALERGLPAMLGVLSIFRLPYPSRSFDMAHCARCLIKWASREGLYLLEIDRILRPGGYWVLSGPPINGKNMYKGWERTPEDLEAEQNGIEDLAKRLCWKKIAENGPVAVWRKPTNHIHCATKLNKVKSPSFCEVRDPDAAWYVEMQSCITPLPKVEQVRDTAGGGMIAKWPKRLNAVPPRIKSWTVEGVTAETFNQDNQIWSQRVSNYGFYIKFDLAGKYRNIMDMNAGLGGFASALAKYPVWVMNVVPANSSINTLGVIYERGLIGTYMNWFSSAAVFSLPIERTNGYLPHRPRFQDASRKKSLKKRNSVAIKRRRQLGGSNKRRSRERSRKIRGVRAQEPPTAGMKFPAIDE